MQTMKTTLLVLMCLALLGACGLKGPLYLPEDDSTVKQESTPDTDTETEKEKEKENNTGKESVSSK